MQRFHQVVFSVSLLALCWFVMMAIHELGHVIGAYVTGGGVEQVVLHPLTISRTDVSPNPNPSVVVWLGPIVGCFLPVAMAWLVPRGNESMRKVAEFFAGFCLLANGSYIAFGAIDKVGDCGVMLQNGSPLWMLFLFGALTIPLGFLMWHRLGSVKEFCADPALADPTLTYSIVACLATILTLEILISPK